MFVFVNRKRNGQTAAVWSLPTHWFHCRWKTAAERCKLCFHGNSRYLTMNWELMGKKSSIDSWKNKHCSCFRDQRRLHFVFQSQENDPGCFRLSIFNNYMKSIFTALFAIKYAVRRICQDVLCVKIERLRALQITVRSGAEERTFSGTRLDILIFRLHSYHVLNHIYCRWWSAKVSQTHDVLSSGWHVLVFSGWTFCGHAFFGVRSFHTDTVTYWLSGKSARILRVPHGQDF